MTFRENSFCSFHEIFLPYCSIPPRASGHGINYVRKPENTWKWDSPCLLSSGHKLAWLNWNWVAQEKVKCFNCFKIVWSLSSTRWSFQLFLFLFISRLHYEITFSDFAIWVHFFSRLSLSRQSTWLSCYNFHRDCVFLFLFKPIEW